MWPKVLIVLLGLVALYAGYNIYSVVTLRAQLVDVRPEHVMVPGNAEDADLNVVEFLSYSCIHCRTVHPLLKDALTQDGRVRYIPRPLPVTDAEGFNAARIVYAAGEHGRFFEMHDLLMRETRMIDEETVLDLALQAGIAPQDLKEAMTAESVRQALNDNAALYTKLDSPGTPLFMIGNILYQPLSEQTTVQDFLDIFAQARGQK